MIENYLRVVTIMRICLDSSVQSAGSKMISLILMYLNYRSKSLERESVAKNECDHEIQRS